MKNVSRLVELQHVFFFAVDKSRVIILQNSTRCGKAKVVGQGLHFEV